MNKNKIAALIGLLVVGVGVYFFSGSEKTTTKFFPKSDVGPGDVVIKISDNGYSPTEVTINRGERVVWVNESNDFAWPASDPHPTHTNDEEFDPQEPMKTGEAWSFTFIERGEWQFHDHLKPSRRGVVKVK